MGLATVKRYAELHNRIAVTTETSSRRAYRTEDAAPLLSIGTSSFMGAIIALGLYVGSDEVRVIYRRPDWLGLICPLLLAWSSRLWLLGHRGQLKDEDPVAFALRDSWTHLAVVIVGIVFLLAL